MPRPDGDTVDYNIVHEIANAIEKLFLIDKWTAFNAVQAQDLIDGVAELEISEEFKAITSILTDLGVAVRTDADAAKVSVSGANRKKSYNAVKADITAFR